MKSASIESQTSLEPAQKAFAQKAWEMVKEVLAERLLSVEEARTRIGIGVTMTYELIARGCLIAKKVGRRTLLLESSVSAYIQSLPDADIGKGKNSQAA